MEVIDTGTFQVVDLNGHAPVGVAIRRSPKLPGVWEMHITQGTPGHHVLVFRGRATTILELQRAVRIGHPADPVIVAMLEAEASMFVGCQLG